MNERSSGRAVEEATHSLGELGVSVKELPFEGRHGAQWQEADHRSNLQPLRASVGETEDVVEEAILLVPHAGVRTRMHHRRGDPEEVLDELLGQLRIRRAVHRELRGDLEHVLAEHRHPRRAIRLLEVSAGR